METLTKKSQSFQDGKKVGKNLQQPYGYAHLAPTVRPWGGSPLFAVGLWAGSGDFRRQFTHLNMLHPEG
jgi:hypothetical protein